MKVSWPQGRKFAFTIFDDTDWATVEKVKPVYDLLADLGMLTTKSVWVFSGQGTADNAGSTCEDPRYLEWTLSLQRRGFEIAQHCVAPGTSARERTYRGLGRFRELYGYQTWMHCNHVGCLENIYWGDARLSGWGRGLYNLLTRGSKIKRFRGHLCGDPLFWGDLCQERIRYVRNFVFDDLNTLAMCPRMPYHDPEKPYVNFWFASADGSNRHRFLRNFALENLDRLIDSRGLCIAYVHFAAGFTHNGTVDAEFQRRMEYVASRDGWFAPVSQILDHLRNGGERKDRIISSADRRVLETRWLASKLAKGASQLITNRLRAPVS